MIDIRSRKTWEREDEVSFEVEAFVDGKKMFTPGATVTRDRAARGATPEVSIRWASSSSSGDLDSAKAQLAVMTVAVEIAGDLVDELGPESEDEVASYVTAHS